MTKNARAIATLCTVLAGIVAPASATAQPNSVRPAPARATTAMPPVRPKLRFEANRGQTDARAGFVARGRGFTLFLSPTEAVYALAAGDDAARETTVRMALVGASERARGEGEGAIAGRTSYFVGKDRSRWVADVPSFAGVRYRDVYPGVDLVYHGGESGEAEYDFVLAPGADVSKIALCVEGSETVRVDGDDLVIATCSGELRHRRPSVYQTVDGARRAVDGRYDLRTDGTIGFRVADYDRSIPLVVDPVIAYSTLLGGSLGDTAESTGVDASGAIYLAGGTDSADFPSANSPGGTTRGNTDVFVTKLTPAGDAIAYSVVLGGSEIDYAAVVKVSPAGEVIVRGLTGSSDFPTSNAAQPNYGGNLDVFVLKLNAAGTALVYSTYLGGSSVDECFVGLGTDAAGDAFVGGCTMSTDFPVKNAPQATLGGATDGFLVKYGPTGEVAFSTYFGGSGNDVIADVTPDPNGRLVLGGFTDSTDFPTIDPVQAALAGGRDAFIAKTDANGTPIYSTYYGGSGAEIVTRVAVDSLGAVYADGQTSSTDLPTVGAFQSTYGGGSNDGFVLKLAPDGASVEYASYLGGSGDDSLYVMAVDALGAAHVAGNTNSTDFPTVDPLQATYAGGGVDLVVAKVSPTGDALEYSTYLGGSGGEYSNHGVVDTNGNTYISFFTSSNDLPLVKPLQAALDGSQDAGVFKIADTYALDWNAPAAESAAPTDLEATLVDTGTAKAFPSRTSSERSPRATLTGYNVYRSNAPNVATTPENLFTSAPATQTSVPGAPGGSFYVVTATYDDGTESSPSNQAGAGTDPGPGLATVKVKPAKVTAKGSGFTDVVQVFLDGIPFASPAKVKNGAKVVQAGLLLTGESVGQYLAAHGKRAIVTFRNRDGGVSTFTYKK